jgi:hypothetical protein
MRKVAVFAMNELMPAHDDMPGIFDTKAEDFLKEFKANAHPIMRLGFFLSVWVYALSPVFTIGIPLPAFLLSEQKRLAHLDKYANSRNFVFSQLWMLQKMITAMCWGMDDKVRAYYGYEPYPEEPGNFKKGGGQ